MRPLLENELLSVRLYAARQAESAEVLRGSRLPRVVLWWALARLGFTGEPGPRWLVRRRMVQRRRRLDREACLASFEQVSHPLACLAHACRLVELHGQDAIPALLAALPRLARSEPHAEAAAWALGTLGRSILAETLGAARKASPATRHWMLLALWFLGPEAHGAEKELLGWAEPMAEAVLLNLESRAAARAAREGQVEVVYLDDEAVAELAGQIFGDVELVRRRRAVRALRGFGPAREAAVKLLSACLDVPELSQVAAQTLVEYHPDEALRPLLRDESFLPHVARLPAVRQKLAARLLDENEPHRSRVARVAYELAIELTDLIGPQGVSALLLETQPTMRWEMLQHIDIRSLRLPDLVICAADEHPGVRLVAAAVLRDRTEGLELLRQLADDPDVDVALEATVGLLQQLPDDEALAARLLRDRWMRKRALARLKEPTLAISRAISAGLIREEPSDPPRLETTLASDQVISALRKGNIDLLKRASSPERVVRLLHEHPDLLDEEKLTALLAALGPRLSQPEVLKPFLTGHPSAITGIVLTCLRRTSLSREELEGVLAHPESKVRETFAQSYTADHSLWLLERLAEDPSPLVRAAAARSVDSQTAERLLADPDRAVREAAAMRLRILRVLPDGLLEQVAAGQVDQPELLHLVQALAPAETGLQALEAAFRAGQRLATAPFLGARLELVLELGDAACLELALTGALHQGLNLEPYREALRQRPEVGRVVPFMTPNVARRHRELLLDLCLQPDSTQDGIRGLGKVLLAGPDPAIVQRLLELLGDHPAPVLRALGAAHLEPEQGTALLQHLPDLPPALMPLAWSQIWSTLSEDQRWQALNSILHPEVEVQDAEFLLHRLLERTAEQREVGLGLDQPEPRWRLARLLLARGMVNDENVLAYLQQPGDLTPTRRWASALYQALKSEQPEVAERARVLLEKLA